MREDFIMKTKAIIFDKDGTLLDFDAFWVTISIAAVKDILKGLGCENASVEDVLSALGVEDGITNIDGVLCSSTYSKIGDNIHYALSKCGYNFDLERVRALTLDAFARHVDKGIIKATCQNIREVLLDIKNAGIKIFVVTSDRLFTTEKCLHGLGIHDIFDAVYTDDGDVAPKPKPDCIYDICDKFSVSPDEIIMVGDTVNDVNFAKNGGIKMIGVAKGEKNIERFLKQTDVVLPDVSYILNYVKENAL